MKVLIISDIHGNWPALRELAPDIESSDAVLCLGDMVGYHCYVNEVIDFLRKAGVICIQGNHERYVLEGLECQTKAINDSVRFGIEMAQSRITSDNLRWIASLPTSISFKFERRSVLCCHGSPWSVTDQYVYADSDLFPRMDEFGFDLIALGHTHREFLVGQGEKRILNPGSVGQARDHEGFACASVWDVGTNQIERIRRPYDYMETIGNSLANGAGEWVYKHFKTVL